VIASLDRSAAGLSPVRKRLGSNCSDGASGSRYPEVREGASCIHWRPHFRRQYRRVAHRVSATGGDRLYRFAGAVRWRNFLLGVQGRRRAPHFPGFTIEAQRGTPTVVTYNNDLPLAPFLQKYGGEAPSAFDGAPDAWFTPGLADKGKGFVTNIYTYPNRQEAATLWFRDHALGITRLNIYAGLAAFYLIRDSYDTGVPGTGLDLPAGPRDRALHTRSSVRHQRPVALPCRKFGGA
jgi:Multicopper oxidase